MLTSSRQPSLIRLYPSQPGLSRHTPLIQAPVILASNDLLLWPLAAPTCLQNREFFMTETQLGYLCASAWDTRSINIH